MDWRGGLGSLVNKIRRALAPRREAGEPRGDAGAAPPAAEPAAAALTPGRWLSAPPSLRRPFLPGGQGPGDGWLGRRAGLAADVRQRYAGFGGPERRAERWSAGREGHLLPAWLGDRTQLRLPAEPPKWNPYASRPNRYWFTPLWRQLALALGRRRRARAAGQRLGAGWPPGVSTHGDRSGSWPAGEREEAQAAWQAGAAFAAPWPETSEGWTEEGEIAPGAMMVAEAWAPAAGRAEGEQGEWAGSAAAAAAHWAGQARLAESREGMPAEPGRAPAAGDRPLGEAPADEAFGRASGARGSEAAGRPGGPVGVLGFVARALRRFDLAHLPLAGRPPAPASPEPLLQPPGRGARATGAPGAPELPPTAWGALLAARIGERAEPGAPFADARAAGAAGPRAASRRAGELLAGQPGEAWSEQAARAGAVQTSGSAVAATRTGAEARGVAAVGGRGEGGRGAPGEERTGEGGAESTEPIASPTAPVAAGDAAAPEAATQAHPAAGAPPLWIGRPPEGAKDRQLVWEGVARRQLDLAIPGGFAALFARRFRPARLAELARAGFAERRFLAPGALRAGRQTTGAYAEAADEAPASATGERGWEEPYEGPPGDGAWGQAPSARAERPASSDAATSPQRAGLDRARLGEDVGSLVEAWTVGRQVERSPGASGRAGRDRRGPMAPPPAVREHGLNDEDTMLAWLRELGAARYGPRAELALAPQGAVQRQPAEPAVESSAGGGEGRRGEESTEAAEPDLDALAHEVYTRLRLRLEIERERVGGRL